MDQVDLIRQLGERIFHLLLFLAMDLALEVWPVQLDELLNQKIR